MAHYVSKPSLKAKLCLGALQKPVEQLMVLPDIPSTIVPPSAFDAENPICMKVDFLQKSALKLALGLGCMSME